MKLMAWPRLAELHPRCQANEVGRPPVEGTGKSGGLNMGEPALCKHLECAQAFSLCPLLPGSFSLSSYLLP